MTYLVRGSPRATWLPLPALDPCIRNFVFGCLICLHTVEIPEQRPALDPRYMRLCKWLIELDLSNYLCYNVKKRLFLLAPFPKGALLKMKTNSILTKGECNYILLALSRVIKKLVGETKKMGGRP